MIFRPEKLRIKDQRMKPFIDSDELWGYLNTTPATKGQVREVIAKSLDTISESVRSLNFNPDENVLFAGSDDGPVRMFQF